jgi:hypothetical protein
VVLLGLVLLSSVGKFGSCFDALPTLAWGVLGVLLSFTRDLVITILYSRCPLAGSVLHGPEREGRQPSPVITWLVWCDEVRWFHKEAWWHLCGYSCFLCLSLICFVSLIYFVRGFPHHFVSVWPCGFIYKAGRKLFC